MRFFLGLLFLGSIAQASDVPNGLCLLKDHNGSFGQGFVVGSYLFSAAHVLLRVNGDWVCTQNGNLVPVKAADGAKVIAHARYSNTHDEIGHLPTDSPWWLTLDAFARFPYDLAYVRLAEAPATDFLLDPSANLADTFELVQRLPEAPTQLAILDETGTQGSVEQLGTLFAVDVRYIAGDAPVQFVSDRTIRHRVRLFLNYELPAAPGDSGSPLFHRSAGGKLLVAGILTGELPITLPEPLVPAALADQRPTRFAALQNWVTALRAAHPELFPSASNCPELLATTP